MAAINSCPPNVFQILLQRADLEKAFKYLEGWNILFARNI
ncbi:hypothetical protein LEP1GSC127_4108 [Leptospira kirschneri str. 200801925]|nr:hypothetical protein LEP1GSC018_2251 [Leptospira kirschneri str. 2008720114]EMK05262.1 hypothetical protein LEP1GSC166_0896 [Leptospira kirschneri]EMO75056.1 hypothetical protein LEP1GSC127_4108 [Leptospira kirschneri str. 200801925]